MSVYTQVEEKTLNAWLAHFSVGALKSLTPIAAGIENTNYFLSTDKGEFVLTLYERLPERDLPFYLNLMVFLAEKGLPIPAPQKLDNGAYYQILNGKPAAVITRVNGAPQLSPTVAQCAEIGRVLGETHRASATFPQTLDNPRGGQWREEVSQAVMPFLTPDQQTLLKDEMSVQRKEPFRHLPRGAVHADLFRDNVLFENANEPRVAGVIDFGFAATDSFLYDLAITVNDWCIGDTKTGALDRARTHALLNAYQSVRALTEEEKALWHLALSCGALRFWLSRLYDFHLPRPGALVHAHDPTRFERILRKRREAPERWAV